MTDEPTAETNVNRTEVAKFGNLADEWWDESGSLKTLHAINPIRLAYIEQFAELESARVLDVGCGAGILSEALARRGAAVTGIDLAPQNIAAARTHAEAQQLSVEYEIDCVENVAAGQPGSYDVVTCLELLEHVPDPEQSIAACARAVRPGGTVFFSTINRNIKSFLLAIVAAEYALGMLPRGTHEYAGLIRPSELGRAARQAGLDILDLSGLHHNPLTGRYWLGGNVDVNYLVCARRPEDG
jgi:2-polyprenyl-6-hydroxyphenyl methylase/3-demethylubiquinone-9 3-methyltransferase